MRTILFSLIAVLALTGTAHAQGETKSQSRLTATYVDMVRLVRQKVNFIVENLTPQGPTGIFMDAKPMESLCHSQGEAQAMIQALYLLGPNLPPDARRAELFAEVDHKGGKLLVFCDTHEFSNQENYDVILDLRSSVDAFARYVNETYGKR